MPTPKNPDPGKEATDARRRDEAVKKLAKAVEITADDVARHPGEGDYDKDAR